MKLPTRQLGARVAFAIAASVCFIAAQAAPPRYELTVLPSGLEPKKINNKGQIVGRKVFATLPTGRLFVYTRGSILLLSPLKGYYDIQGSGINDAGQVVGDTWNHAHQRSFILNLSDMRVSVIENLDGEDYSTAVDINDAGDVVGFVESEGSFTPRGWLHRAGNTIDLGTQLDHDQVFPRAINGAGVVVGTSNRSAYPFEDHAFIYTEGSMTNIGWGKATDINDAGDVSGNTFARGPFVYKGGVRTYLPPPAGVPARSIWVTAINNVGQVVGYAASEDKPRAVIYTHGKMFDLNKLTTGRRGFELQIAYDINDAGQVIGRGRPAGASQNDSRAFLLTPLQSPAAPQDARPAL
jgi:probable HAF family extracellular repeat protein